MFLIQLCESGRRVLAHQHREWGRWGEGSSGAWELGLSGELPGGNSSHLDGAGLHSPAVVRPTDAGWSSRCGNLRIAGREG